MKNEEILKKLRDAKGFVSGQELCEYYGVSPVSYTHLTLPTILRV